MQKWFLANLTCRQDVGHGDEVKVKVFAGTLAALGQGAALALQILPVPFDILHQQVFPGELVVVRKVVYRSADKLSFFTTDK